MIDEIDEQMSKPEEAEEEGEKKRLKSPPPVVKRRREGPPTEPPTSPTPKAKSRAWPHDRQPLNREEAALHEGWCLA